MLWGSKLKIFKLSTSTSKRPNRSETYPEQRVGIKLVSFALQQILQRVQIGLDGVDVMSVIDAESREISKRLNNQNLHPSTYIVLSLFMSLSLLTNLAKVRPALSDSSPPFRSSSSSTCRLLSWLGPAACVWGCCCCCCCC